MRRFLLFALALAAVPLLEPEPAAAHPAVELAHLAPAHPAVELAQSAPSVAGSIAPAFDFTCTTTGQLITDGGGAYTEIAVWNAACSAGTCTPSATPVFIGAPNVTTSTGMPICNTAGCRESIDLEVRGAGCVVLAGTVHVTAMVIR